MFGLNIDFTCLECEKDNTADVSICALYTVNAKPYEYVRVDCNHCQTAYYAATHGVPVKEMTLEAKLEALYQRGGAKASERAKQDWVERTPFFLASEYLVRKDAEDTVALQTGAACF